MSEPTRPMGIIHGMSFEDYLSIDAVSSSSMKPLSRSAWHYKNRVPVEETRAMLCGSLVHCAQLEPDALGARYVVTPDDAPKRPTAAQWRAKNPAPESVVAMKWWTDFNESLGARRVITADEYRITQLQLAAIARSPTLRDLLATGESEVSVFWEDPSTGIYCKARPDHVYEHGDVITLVDLKSTADESPSAFGRTAARLGYHRQAAHYAEGYAIASGKTVDAFVFCAVTSAPPVLAVPYVLADSIAQQGKDERRELLDLLAECLRTDTWPSYGDAIQTLQFPAYATRSSEVEVGFVE